MALLLAMQVGYGFVAVLPLAVCLSTFEQSLTDQGCSSLDC